MLMIRPPSPWAIICLAASCVPKNALLRLIAKTLSYCASVVSSSEVRVSTPALFTITSSRPKAFTACSMSICRSAILLTSASTPTAWPPRTTIRCSSSSVAFLVSDVVDDDVGVPIGEGKCYPLSDPAVATGHDGDLPLERHGGSLQRCPGESEDHRFRRRAHHPLG